EFASCRAVAASIAVNTFRSRAARFQDPRIRSSSSTTRTFCSERASAIVDVARMLARGTVGSAKHRRRKTLHAIRWSRQAKNQLYARFQELGPMIGPLAIITPGRFDPGYPGPRQRVRRCAGWRPLAPKRSVDSVERY